MTQERRALLIVTAVLNCVRRAFDLDESLRFVVQMPEGAEDVTLGAVLDLADEALGLRKREPA